jgi:hypothetical protein
MLTFIKKNPKLWGEDIGLTQEQVLNKYKNLFPYFSNNVFSEKTNAQTSKLDSEHGEKLKAKL